MRMDDTVWDHLPATERSKRKKNSSLLAIEPNLHIFFRVEFFVENINALQHEKTRHLYYLQVGAFGRNRVVGGVGRRRLLKRLICTLIGRQTSISPWVSQVKSDIVAGRLATASSAAAQLAALALQAQFGDFDPAVHRGAYFNPVDFFNPIVLGAHGVRTQCW